jgi:hypothetical protein
MKLIDAGYSNFADYELKTLLLAIGQDSDRQPLILLPQGEISLSSCLL